MTFFRTASIYSRRQTRRAAYFDNITALLNETFAEVRRGTGATVIAAAGAAEYALESERWKNGVFTYSLRRGLEDGAADADRDGAVSLTELQPFVAAEVTRLTNGLQKPVARRAPPAADFTLARKQNLLYTLRHFWQTKGHALLETINAHAGPVNAVSFSPDNQTLATGSGDKAAKLWRYSCLKISPP